MSACRGGGKWAYRLGATLMLLLSAVSCATGGSAIATPGPSAGTSLHIALIVGAAPSTTQARLRRPKFISARTQGVKIALAGSATYSGTFDLSPGSQPCAGVTTSPRTCTGNFTSVAPGTYTVTVNTYDQPPEAGAIPAAAHLLATGSVTGVSVVLGAANITSVIVGGVIASYGNTAFISVPNDGSSHQIGFALAPSDLAGEAIIAGATIDDAYANPISLTLTESGGSLHETLVKNGVNVGTSATISKSTDTVQVNYDGGGSPGYSGSIAIAAAGLITAAVSVSPMFVTPSNFATGRTVTFSSNTNSSTFATTEANASNTVSYAATALNCSGIASTAAFSGNGASSSVVVAAGATRSSGGCTIAIADSLGTGTEVTYGIVNSTITYSSRSLDPTALIQNLAPGPDGKLWAVDTHNQQIYTVTPAGVATALSRPTTTFKPRYIIRGPDDNMWVSDQDRTNGQSQIECITISGAGCGIYPVPAGATPAGIVTGSDGNLWFAATGGTNSIDRITPQGVITQFGSPTITTPDATCGPQLALGGDGNVWFTELNNSVGRITPGGVVTEFSAGTNASRTYAITRAPDGSLWFTDFAASQIGHITFDGSNNPTISAIAVVSADHPATAVSKPWDITFGGDGNVWFVQSHSLGRLTTAGSLTVAKTTTQGNIGMTTATDGSVWYGDGQVGIVPLGGGGGPYVVKVNF